MPAGGLGLLIGLVGCAAQSSNFTSNFTLSHLFGSEMVLQAGEPAPFWGTGPAGASVTVSAGRAKATAAVTADGAWLVSLPPMQATPAGGGLTVTASAAGGAVFATLEDVRVGEVFLCSGQSNMEFTLPGVFNATAECSEAAFDDLDGLRVMRVGRTQADAPLRELPASAFDPPGFAWARAAKRNVCGDMVSRGVGFSAACFLFGRELHRRLGVPVGLVDSSWGGTMIENWMSARAYGSCPHAPCANCTSEVPGNSTLWNGMLTPYARLPMAAFVWWQGTSNSWTVENAAEYDCNQRALIGDIRATFAGAAQLPFLFVQIHPQFGDLAGFQPYPGWVKGSRVTRGLAELRLAQSRSLALPRVGMACSVDLGDVGGPFTWEHNRGKQECASRLVRAAVGIMYANRTGAAPVPPWRGPEPSGVTVLEPQSHGEKESGPYVEIELTFSMFGSAGFSRQPFPLSVLSFEALVEGPTPSTEGGFWVPMTLLPYERTDVANSVGLAVTSWVSSNATLAAVRYAHADFPVGILHTLEGLPLPPFVFNCSVPIRKRQVARYGP